MVAPPPTAAGKDSGEEWAGLFKGKLNAKGMSLSFVAPLVKDGKKVAQLQEDELTTGTSNATIFYVVGYSPTIAAVTRFLAQQWSNLAKPLVYWHEDGYFIINFQSKDDMHTVLYSGPHMFYGKPAIVKPWSAKFDFHAEILRVVPLWVKFPNLPLHCWSPNTLSRIGSTLGVPVCADSCTSRQLRVSFARLLVEIDVTQPLLNTISIELPGGTMQEQKVVYEWTPPFCTSCNKVGHDCAKAKPPPTKKVWVPKKAGNDKPAPEVVKNPEPKQASEPAVDEGWQEVGRKSRVASHKSPAPSIPKAMPDAAQTNSFEPLQNEGLEKDNHAGKPKEGDGNPSPIG